MFIFADAKNQKYKDVTIMGGLRNTEIKNFRGVDFWDNIPYSVSSPLTIPAKKTKIYAYLETLLGKSKTQKKLIKDANRNYENTQHWESGCRIYLELLCFFIIC